MRWIDFGIMWACLTAHGAAAQTFSESRRLHTDCLLSHVGDTQSPFGVRLIDNACRYLSLGSSRPHPSSIAYAECILAVIPGAGSDAASSSLASACRQRFPVD